MIGNIRYYVLTVASIFLALGIGIFIGFLFDAQEIVGAQKQDIVSQLEERFSYLQNENQQIKNYLTDSQIETDKYQEFSESVFFELIKNKLDGIKIAIIETNDDYVYSNLSRLLESAGAEVTSLSTINDKIMMVKESIREIYDKGFDMGVDTVDPTKKLIEYMTKAIVTGRDTDVLLFLDDEELIELLGDYSSSIDYIIIAGGSSKKDIDKVNIIDNNIINYCKKVNVPIIGVEKEKVKYSYIGLYKELRISTVDNVDTIFGQVALILAMNGNPGHYGVKPESESLMPRLYSLFDY